MTSRNQTLDFLRAISILLVLFAHSQFIYPQPGTSAVSLFFFGIARAGWYGVDVFFVLSGYLISGLLFREILATGRFSIGRFLVRRWLKIIPSFLGLMVPTILVLWWMAQYDRLHLHSILGEFLFLQNYWGQIWGHTWSLAVEEHFYLLLPLVLLWNRYRVEIVPTLFWLLACVCLILRALNLQNYPYFPPTHIYPTHLRIDALMFGVYLSYLSHFKGLSGRIEKYKHVILTIGIAVCLQPFFVDMKSPWMSSIGLTLNYLGSGLVLVSLLAFRINFRGILQVFPQIGKYSYSIYLWHMPVVQVLVPAVQGLMPQAWNMATFVIIYGLGSIVLGIGLSKLIEYPVLEIRDRLFPVRKETAKGDIYNRGCSGRVAL